MQGSMPLARSLRRRASLSEPRSVPTSPGPGPGPSHPPGHPNLPQRLRGKPHLAPLGALHQHPQGQALPLHHQHHLAPLPRGFGGGRSGAMRAHCSSVSIRSTAETAHPVSQPQLRAGIERLSTFRDEFESLRTRSRLRRLPLLVHFPYQEHRRG
jgi:hypothetical protein